MMFFSMIEDRKIKLPKSFQHRIQELTQSLQIIRDSLKLIAEGKQYQILPLYGQLRSLLTEKSRQNPSLFLDISEKLQYPLELYYLPSKPFPENFPKLAFVFMSPEISTSKQDIKQEKITLNDFLETTMITLKGIDYSTKDLIRSLANIAGGSHYSSKIPKNYAELFSIGLYGINELKKLGIPNPQIINSLIVQIGSVVFKLGLKLLRQISEFEYFIHFYIPTQTLDNEAFVLDMNYQDTLMRTALLFDKNFKLYFVVQDSNGLLIKVKIDDYIELDDYFLINISYGLTDQLKTKILVYLNNTKAFESEFDQILSFRNDFNFFSMYQNRSIEKSDQGMILGMLQYYLYSRVLEPSERGKIMFHIESELEKKYKMAWYTKGNYGYTEHDSAGLKMHGSVKHLTLEEFLNQNGN